MDGPTPEIGWEQMSDVDRGCALLHIWKCRREGFSYAVEHYPCRYLDDPRLVSLDRQEASKHAVRVASRLPVDDEWFRLYDLALGRLRGRQ